MKRVSLKKTLETGIIVANQTVEYVTSDICHTKLTLSACAPDGSAESHLLDHILWTGWPDKVCRQKVCICSYFYCYFQGVPPSTISMLRLIQMTQSYPTTIVHCSAGLFVCGGSSLFSVSIKNFFIGVGRTGTVSI